MRPVALDGLSKAFKTATRPERTESEPDEQAVDKTVSAIVENPSAIQVAALPGLGTGAVAVYVAQGVGDMARMVRLDVTEAFIASLADKAPDPMSNAPDRLVFFRQLLMTGSAIIPDQISDMPVEPLAPGEKVSATTKMLPSNAIFLVRDGVFSIAASRKLDTMVVEVAPFDGILGAMRNGFIDTMTRNTMLDRLSETSKAVGYIGDDTISIDDAGRIAFKHKRPKLSGQLLIKPLTQMRSVFTHRVHGFTAGAAARMDDVARADFAKSFLAPLVKKRDDLAVSVSIASGTISFQHGRAGVVTTSGLDTDGTATARVRQADFRRALGVLLDLPLENELEFAIDAKGMLMIGVQTMVADFRVYLQTIRAGDPEGSQVLDRTRLERVERPTEPDVRATA